MERPAWVPDDLYPFADRYAEVGGARVHYVDEGDGPPLLLLHGNPTWSFLYREIIAGLRDRFRCIAVDLPGFGLSTSVAGSRHTAAEHADVIERLVVEHLDLRDVTMMVQDWGGPIGLAAAVRHPDRFAAFVIGNTWAWPMTGNRGAHVFSRVLGSPLGHLLITRANVFVERILPGGVRRTTLPPAVMDAYRGPFPTPASREPIAVLPREILAARELLLECDRGLPALRDRRALIVWPTADVAFREGERRRWESVFAHPRTVMLEGAGHYIQEDAPQEIVAAIRDWAGPAPT